MRNEANNLIHEKISSTIGFFLGSIGVLIALLSILNIGSLGLFSLVTPILLGFVGFILSFKVKTKLNDDIVKAGLVINPVSIVLGGLQIFL